MNIITLASAVAAAYMGYYLPDVDVAPIVPLKHRSAWTHGPLLPLAVLWCAGRWPDYRTAWVCALAGLMVHLIADVSPRKWHGSALVNCFPLPLTLPAPLSFVYIAGSTVVAVWCLMVSL